MLLSQFIDTINALCSIIMSNKDIKTLNIIDLLKAFSVSQLCLYKFVASLIIFQDGRSDGQLCITGRINKPSFTNVFKVALDMHLPVLGVQKPIST